MTLAGSLTWILKTRKGGESPSRKTGRQEPRRGVNSQREPREVRRLRRVPDRRATVPESRLERQRWAETHVEVNTREDRVRQNPNRA